jgi:hypothetical protein
VFAGAFALAAGAGVAPAGVLFTTAEDFAQWNDGDNSDGIQEVGVASGSIDASTTNGLANNTAAGAAGTSGSLSATWISGTYDFFFGPGIQGNAAALADLGTTAAATATPTNGILQFDYIEPPPGTGNYFQLGVVLNYDGNFGQFFGSSVNNGNGTFTATVPYTINPHPALSYFQLGLIYNSNFNTATPFTVDNVLVVPEPASATVLAAAGGLITLRRQRSRQGWRQP